MKKHIALKAFALFIVLELFGCGDMIIGAGHMAYGFSIFYDWTI
jgi:hypothetical protein